jgi:hypothetical protein
MLKRSLVWLVLILIGSAVLTACNQQQSDSPVSAVETYITTRNTSDTQKLVALACKAWESKATIEADSFRSRDPKLEGMKCTEAGKDGEYTIVKCEGQVITNYQGESRPFDLAARNFRVVQEDGRWKMCGYAAS